MSRVFVLGAGASKCYDQSKTGQRPPLANEIIKCYNQLDIAANPYVRVGDIVNFARDCRGISPDCFRYWDDDIERVLTEIDERLTELTTHIRSTGDWENVIEEMVQSTRAYNQFMFLFASILNEIQNGPVSKVHAAFCQAVTDSDTILTFNWDTLLDRALMETHDWHPSSGYGVEVHGVFDDDWKPVADASVSLGPQYLKLHGSTNWLTAYNQPNLSTGEIYALNQASLDKLYVYLHSTSRYDTFENRWWGGYAPFSYCYYPPNLPLLADPPRKGFKTISTVIAPDLPDHNTVRENDQAVYSMPVLIPPVRNKDYTRFGKIFKTLWDKGARSLRTCDEIFLIGYSMPKTDTLVLSYMRENLIQNDALKSFIIVNPNPDQLRAKVVDDLQIPESKVVVHQCQFDESAIMKILS